MPAVDGRNQTGTAILLSRFKGTKTNGKRTNSIVELGISTFDDSGSRIALGFAHERGRNTESAASARLTISGQAEVESGDAPPNVTGRLFSLEEQEPEIFDLRFESSALPEHRRSFHTTIPDCLSTEATYDDAGFCMVELMFQLTSWDPIPVEVDWRATLRVGSHSPFFDPAEHDQPPELLLVEIDFLGTDLTGFDDEDDGEGDE